VTVASSGACLQAWSVGVIEGGRIAFPPLPGDGPVQSLRYDVKGRLYAMIGTEPCEDDAAEYRLDGTAWVPTNGDTGAPSAEGRWPSVRPR
jgi:hypothetical protein